MGDFLGSYYDSGDLHSSEFDERVLSQRIALLNAEQPVSILEMDHLESAGLRARLHDVDTLIQVNSLLSSRPSHANNQLGVEEAPGLEEDLEIPVASMSTFEKGMPSLVSVQLMSVKGEDLARKGELTRWAKQVEPTMPQPELEYDVCSPLSAAKLLEAQRTPHRRFTVNIDERKREEKVDLQELEMLPELAYNELVEKEERAARAVQADKHSLRASFLKLLGKSRKKK